MGGGPAPPPPPGALPGLPPRPEITPSHDLRRLHWSKIPDARIRPTIWFETLNDDGMLDDGARRALEAAFDARPAGSAAASGAATGDGTPPGPSAPKDTPREVTVLSTDLVQPCEIALRQMDLLVIAANLEAGRDVHELEQLHNLATLKVKGQSLEEKEESILEVAGEPTLRKLEQRLLPLLRVGRWRDRVRALKLRASWQANDVEINRQIKACLDACQELRHHCESEEGALCVVLGTVLAMGNHLNGGTPKGRAYGYALDSLGKLKSSKATDGSGRTLLEHLAHTLVDQHPEATAEKVAALPRTLQAVREVASQVRPPAEGETRSTWWTDVQTAAREQIADGTFLTGLVSTLGENDPFIQSLRGEPNSLRQANERLSDALQRATTHGTEMVQWLEGKSPQASEQRGIDAVLRGLHLFLVDLGAATLHAMDTKRAQRAGQGEPVAAGGAAAESPQAMHRRLSAMAANAAAARQAEKDAAAVHENAVAAELRRREVAPVMTPGSTPARG